MRTFTLLFFGCLFAVNLSAQASLSGTVTTESGTAEFMNVALLQAADSAVIKLNLTDEDGRFTFSDLAPGDYRLRVMGIGYADYDTDLFTLT
ncbi:MAG: carboxypeptidase-like regulatory domain-containing protein, partial [Saprospiraceae bacterium]